MFLCLHCIYLIILILCINSYFHSLQHRSWLEQIGVWGAPFTPPPGISEPDLVYPINVVTAETSAEYSEAYPLGFHTPYTYLSYFSLPVPTPTDPPTTVVPHGTTTDHDHVGYSTLSMCMIALSAAIFGGVIGAYITLWFAKRVVNASTASTTTGAPSWLDGMGVNMNTYGATSRGQYTAINEASV